MPTQIEDDDAGSGSNCTDETKRDAYLACKKLKIAEELAAAHHKKVLGSYRSELKAWGKRGVNTEAIVYALSVRFEDPDEVLIRERERLKLLALSGFLPNIRDALDSRLDVQESTRNESHEDAILRAEDEGSLAGRTGRERNLNPHDAGTELHVHWVQGWLAGQRAIADEMEVAAGTVKKPRGPGRPKKEVANDDRGPVGNGHHPAAAMFDDVPNVVQ